MNPVIVIPSYWSRTDDLVAVGDVGIYDHSTPISKPLPELETCLRSLEQVRGVLRVIVLVVALLNYWFFGTELGTAVRATGFNPHMIRANGINTDNMIVLGLLLSNGLVAISGALVAQSNGFADVGMGVGTIVIGLASVIIGEVLFGTRSFKNCLISVILGSIVYRAVIAIVLQMGMPPNDLKLFTAILVALALSLPLLQARWHKFRKGVH